jgi:hypothetical protein
MPQSAPAAMKPVILADHYPISAMISVSPADFCLKKTRPTLGSGSAADKASATCYLVEQLQYLYVRVVHEHGVAARSSSARDHLVRVWCHSSHGRQDRRLAGWEAWKSVCESVTGPTPPAATDWTVALVTAGACLMLPTASMLFILRASRNWGRPKWSSARRLSFRENYLQSLLTG